MKSSKTAKNLRKRQTDTEKKLWNALRNNQLAGYKFRRQHPIGNFIVDFICIEKKLIIEVDGSQHIQNKVHDGTRTQWLNAQGFAILRFWDNEILTNLDGAVEMIRMKLDHPHPTLSLLRRARGKNRKNNSSP